MRVKVFVLVGLILLFGRTEAIFAEGDETTARNPIPDRPSMEMIEFLGDFETHQGEWLDPMELEYLPIPDGEQDNEKAKN
jgi:hypothetical protein